MSKEGVYDYILIETTGASNVFDEHIILVYSRSPIAWHSPVLKGISAWPSKSIKQQNDSDKQSNVTSATSILQEQGEQSINAMHVYLSTKGQGVAELRPAHRAGLAGPYSKCTMDGC